MNTKNWFHTMLGASVIASGLALSSCEDEFTEADAIAAQDSTLTALKRLENENAIALDELNYEQQMAFQKYQDSLERIGPVVNYSVTVIAGGSSNTSARTEGENFAEGATVTLVQGGVERTATTNAGGVALFSDLRIGEAVVTVDAADHTMVTFTTSLGDPSFDSQEDNVNTIIPVLPLTVEAGATEISGIVWAELDLTNDAPEFAEGAIVRATIDVEDIEDKYDACFSCTSKGRIQSATYTGLRQTATVGADGRYTLIVPNGNGSDGLGIEAEIEFLPFEAEQTYLAWQGDSLAVVTKNVIFNPEAGGSIGNHIDNDLASVWVEIGAPTGTASGLELVAEATRSAFSTYSDTEIDARGSDYIVGDLFNFSADEDDNVATLEVTAVDADGAITGWTINDNGATYDAAPTLTQDDAASGTGASFLVLFETNYNIKITNEGSGYWEVPEIITSYQYYDNGVLVSDAFDDDITANLVAGKIKDTNSDNIVENVVSATMPTINIKPLEARQAVIDLDDFFINDQNRVEGNAAEYEIEFNGGDADAGEGYVSTPTVTFRSIEGMGSGATGIAEVAGGSISRITITNPGSGYMDEVNDYTYTLSAPASQSDDQTFKPASSNANYNFDFGVGVVKE